MRTDPKVRFGAWVRARVLLYANMRIDMRYSEIALHAFEKRACFQRVRSRTVHRAPCTYR